MMTVTNSFVPVSGRHCFDFLAAQASASHKNATIGKLFEAGGILLFPEADPGQIYTNIYLIDTM